MAVDPDGQETSPEGVSEEGSFFQLWSVHNESAYEYLLDEQFVTSYTPNGSVTIQTGDPYGPVPRTRVDQPFTVRFNVNGLLPPGEGVPLAAQQVAISHEVFNYPQGEHSLENVSDPQGTLVQQGYLSENGDSVIAYSVCNLQDPDLTSAEGEEVFTISALADYAVAATVLDTARVQVWPIAEGHLSGFDSTTEYEDVPTIAVTLTDLYPSSATYVRVYPGPSSASPANAQVVTASYVLINDSIPQDRQLSLTDIDSYLTKHGLHTLEILHETPFGTDLLYSANLYVDREIRMTGGLYSQE